MFGVEYRKNCVGWGMWAKLFSQHNETKIAVKKKSP